MPIDDVSSRTGSRPRRFLGIFAFFAVASVLAACAGSSGDGTGDDAGDGSASSSAPVIAPTGVLAGEVFLPADAEVQLLRSGEDPSAFAVSCAGGVSLRLLDGVSVLATTDGVAVEGSSVSFPPGSGGHVLEVSDGASSAEVRVRCLPERFPRIGVEGTFGQWLALTLTTNTLTGPSFQMLLDSSGFPVWFRPAANALSDFTVYDDALLGFNREARLFYPFANSPGYGFTLESFDGRKITSWIPETGTGLDFHAAAPLPNGNLLAVLYEDVDVPLPKGMGVLPFEGSPYGPQCPARAPDAASRSLRGRVVEVSPDGSFVHLWRMEDHIPTAPASAQWIDIDEGEDLLCAVDAEHFNAVAFYPDAAGSSTGRVLVTGRHIDGAVMLDWPSGDVLWTLGGVEDARALRIQGDPFGGPVHPHDANLIGKDPSGQDLLLIYDNRVPPEPSRGLVYRIDPVAGTATLVETYQQDCGDDPCSAFAMGSSRTTLDGSGILIGWGTEDVSATEFSRGTGKPTAELVLGGNWVYRVLPVSRRDHAELFAAQNRLPVERFSPIAPSD